MTNEKNTMEPQLALLLILWMPMSAAFFLVISSHLQSKELIAGAIIFVQGLIEILILASMKFVHEHKLVSAYFFLKPSLLILCGVALVVNNWGGYTGKALSVGINAILIIMILHPILLIPLIISKRRKMIS